MQVDLNFLIKIIASNHIFFLVFVLMPLRIHAIFNLIYRSTQKFNTSHLHKHIHTHKLSYIPSRKANHRKVYQHNCYNNHETNDQITIFTPKSLLHHSCFYLKLVVKNKNLKRTKMKTIKIYKLS